MDTPAPCAMLLLGGSGQLGTALRARLAALGQVSAPTRAQCDVCDAVSVRRWVQATLPAIIVNAAAYTDVNGAENAPASALAVNPHGPAVLAEVAHQTDALLVHYSSDYVFDGTLGRAYVETDPAQPLNAYGRSKLAGDAAASQVKRHLILRAGWLYSVHSDNFLKTILARLTHAQRTQSQRTQCTQDQRVAVVADQFGTPTAATRLADVTAQLLARYRQDPHGFPFGLYHVAAAGATSWYHYACAVANWLRATGYPVAADAVAPISSAQRTTDPQHAQRPADTRLDTTRLRDTFSIVLPPWQDDVADTLTRLGNTLPSKTPPRCTP